MTPIPVLGSMIYNRPDLMERMVNSIDYPVGQLVIILNHVTEEIAQMADRIRAKVPGVIIYNPGDNQPKPVNLGFAGGWNWFLRNFMKDWILVVGNDTCFLPGQLQKISEYYERHKNDQPPMPVVNTNYGWNCGGITKAGLDIIGYLDENFYPLYYEDCDWNWRHTIAREKGLVSYPAEGECQIQLHHDTSSTSSNLPQEKRDRMAAAFNRNVEYYIRKWGGAQCHEIFKTPFNNPALSIREWRLEPGRWELNKID